MAAVGAVLCASMRHVLPPPPAGTHTHTHPAPWDLALLAARAGTAARGHRLRPPALRDRCPAPLCRPGRCASQAAAAAPRCPSLLPWLAPRSCPATSARLHCSPAACAGNRPQHLARPQPPSPCALPCPPRTHPSSRWYSPHWHPALQGLGQPSGLSRPRSQPQSSQWAACAPGELHASAAPHCECTARPAACRRTAPAEPASRLTTTTCRPTHAPAHL